MNNQEQQHPQPHQPNPPTKSNNNQQWSVYSLALNIGFMIVIPILVFGIGGVLLDKYLDTFPIFVLVGFFLALTSGLLIVYKKSKDIIEQATKSPSERSEPKNTKTPR